MRAAFQRCWRHKRGASRLLGGSKWLKCWLIWQPFRRITASWNCEATNKRSSNSRVNCVFAKNVLNNLEVWISNGDKRKREFFIRKWSIRSVLVYQTDVPRQKCRVASTLICNQLLAASRLSLSAARTSCWTACQSIATYKNKQKNDHLDCENQNRNSGTTFLLPGLT